MRVRGIELLGAWREPELRLLKRFMAPLPRGWLEENPRLTMLVREDVLRNAPPTAPGHSKYDRRRGAIVVYDKGVYHRGQIDTEQFRRSVFHELGHAILTRDPSIIERWRERTSKDGFVDEYAKTNDDEDFCDSFSEFLIFPEKTQRVVPRKWRFLYDLMQPTRPQEKTAMHFMNAFVDELTKTAAHQSIKGLVTGRKIMGKPKKAKKAKPMGTKTAGISSRMKGMSAAVGKLMKSRAAQGATLAGAGVVGGGSLGLAKGKRSGYDQGTDDVGAVAQKALAIGRQQGAQIGYQYAIQQMKGQK